MTFNLTEQQLKDLTVFLSRVQLYGHEAENFSKIIQVLRNPIEYGETKSE